MTWNINVNITSLNWYVKGFTFQMGYSTMLVNVVVWIKKKQHEEAPGGRNQIYNYPINYISQPK